jgi:predicted O-methyltransferase YrrM
VSAGDGGAGQGRSGSGLHWSGSGGRADPRWEKVDGYLAERLLPQDAVLDAALADSAAAGMPPIQVSPLQGRFLHLLARASGARRVLEIGTLGGYSTIWLARAVGPTGRVISLELLEHHAEVARRNLERAGLAEQVEVVVGPALETLPTVGVRGEGPFDFVFIDADKANNAHYLRAALELSHPGTVVVVDNVVRHGTVADPDNASPDVRGTQEMFNLAAQVPGFDVTAIQTVGIKGYDGFLIGYVRG